MRSLIVLWVMIVSVYVTNAQNNDSLNKFFVVGGVGWGIPVSNTTVGSPLDQIGSLIIQQNPDNLKIERPLNTRGGGFKSQLSFGYWFNKYIGLELGLNYMRSMEILDAEIEEEDINGFIYYGKQNSWSTILSINPSVRIIGDRTRRVAPYARFGLLLPVVGHTYASISLQDETGELAREIIPVINEELEGVVNSLDFESRSEFTAKTRGRFSVGFSAAAGVQVKLNQSLSVLGEIGFDMLTIKARDTKIQSFFAGDEEGAVISFTEDDIPTIIETTEYVDAITETSNDTFDTNAPRYNRDDPREALGFRSSYNNAYLNIGILYSF